MKEGEFSTYWIAWIFMFISLGWLFYLELIPDQLKGWRFLFVMVLIYFAWFVLLSLIFKTTNAGLGGFFLVIGSILVFVIVPSSVLFLIRKFEGQIDIKNVGLILGVFIIALIVKRIFYKN